jgi:hypothetical protein
MQYWGEKWEDFMSCGRRHGIFDLTFVKGWLHSDHREGGDLSGDWKKTVENHSLGRVGKGGYSSGLFPTLFNLKRGKK